MDVHLGSTMDGIAAAQRLRAQWGVPCIFLSAFDNAEQLARATLAERVPGLRIEKGDDISLKTNPKAYAKALAKIQPILSRRLTLSTPTHHPTPNASEIIAPYPTDSGARAVKLFRNGANQAVRIPKEFELPGTNALMHREGNRLILELVPDRPKKGTVAALAAALREMAAEVPIDEEFPDGDGGLLPLDDIEFREDSL